MVDVTVLTPTYNRGELLRKLYASLTVQSCMNFCWIIVDDGSTDETEDIVEQMKKEANFHIIYLKKTNGGKHTALNYAYQYITSELTFIVDSDDTVTKNAIEVICDTHNKYHEDQELCGYSFLRGKPNGGLLSTSGVPCDGMKESYVECRINRHIGGDMAEVWLTRCLKEFPFPEFDNEKFLGEDIVWIQMSKKYKMRYFNTIIYISDYLQDGLTNNRRWHNIKSPNGCVVRAEAFLNSDVNIKAKFIAALQYQIYGRFAKIKCKYLFNNTAYKFLFILCYIPAHILYYKWNAEFNSKERG